MRPLIWSATADVWDCFDECRTNAALTHCAMIRKDETPAHAGVSSARPEGLEPPTF